MTSFTSTRAHLPKLFAIACLVLWGAQPAKAYELWLYNNSGNPLIPYTNVTQPDGTRQLLPDSETELPDGYAEQIDTAGFNPIFAHLESQRHFIIQLGKKDPATILVVVFRHRVPPGEEGKTPSLQPEELGRYAFTPSLEEPNVLMIGSDWTFRHQVGAVAPEGESSPEVESGDPPDRETGVDARPTIQIPPTGRPPMRRLPPGAQKQLERRSKLTVRPQSAATLNRPVQSAMPADARVLFLHHSTGECIWNGGVPSWFRRYNEAHGTRYTLEERNFPKESPYGWENFPYDYWNIWVRHAGAQPYQGEPTLEMLTPKFDLIVLKHCFPVCNIEPDTGRGDVASPEKRLENYKLQYQALKKKLRGFPRTRFLVWTGAAQVRGEIDEASATRAKTFFDWVRNDWDEEGDNIYLWDFYTLETGGELYMKPEYGSGDAHPNESFSRRVVPFFGQRIVDVLGGRGDVANRYGGDITKLSPQPEPPDLPPLEPRRRIRLPIRK
jgi:hypothetical protein